MTSLEAAADFRRDELKQAIPCSKCGAREPVRLEAAGCSECVAFPRCGICGRWIGDGSGWLPGYRNVVLDGTDSRVCDVCWGAAS